MTTLTHMVGSLSLNCSDSEIASPELFIASIKAASADVYNISEYLNSIDDFDTSSFK